MVLHPDLELYNPSSYEQQFRNNDSPGGLAFSNHSGSSPSMPPVIRNLPLDARGNVDEWAAMIEKQSEMAKFQHERDVHVR